VLTTVRRRWLTCAALTAPLLCTGLAACGGGDAASSPAPAASSASPASGDSPPSGDAQFQWELRFVSCLRDHGIQVADPDPVKGAPDVVHDAAFLAASKACQAKIGEPPTVTANRGRQKNYLPGQLKAAKCLREHGYDIPDPSLERPFFIPADVDVTQADLDTCLPPKQP
jgi:hypothetical protein